MQSIILSNLVLSFPHAQKKKGFKIQKLCMIICLFLSNTGLSYPTNQKVGLVNDIIATGSKLKPSYEQEGKCLSGPKVKHNIARPSFNEVK